MPSTVARLNDWVGCHAVSDVLTEPTTVSLVAPDSFFQRSFTLSTPQVPLVRRAKKRNVGCWMATQNGADTTAPVGLIASDFVSAEPCTLNDSLPVTTEAPLSDHPLVPDSNEPPGARL